jgi:hypothetical protein
MREHATAGPLHHLILRVCMHAECESASMTMASDWHHMMFRVCMHVRCEFVAVHYLSLYTQQQNFAESHSNQSKSPNIISSCQDY